MVERLCVSGAAAVRGAGRRLLLALLTVMGQRGQTSECARALTCAAEAEGKQCVLLIQPMGPHCMCLRACASVTSPCPGQHSSVATRFC
jgi:hypothetical protein